MTVQETPFDSPPPVPLPSKGGRSRWRSAAFAIALLAIGGAGGFAAGRYLFDDESTASSTDGSTIVQSAPDATLSPNDAQIEQAVVLHAQGRIDEALVIYEAVLKADPANKLALYNIGLIAQGKDQTDDAIAKYDAVLAIDAQYMPALYNLGLLYAAGGQNDKAISLLRKAIEVNPSFAPAKYNLGKLLISTGSNDEGSKLLAEAITLDPTLAPEG